MYAMAKHDVSKFSWDVEKLQHKHTHTHTCCHDNWTAQKQRMVNGGTLHSNFCINPFRKDLSFSPFSFLCRPIAL